MPPSVILPTLELLAVAQTYRSQSAPTSAFRPPMGCDRLLHCWVVRSRCDKGHQRHAYPDWRATAFSVRHTSRIAGHGNSPGIGGIVYNLPDVVHAALRGESIARHLVLTC